MSNYKAGDAVVCIDAQATVWERTFGLALGVKYTVAHTTGRCTSVLEVQFRPGLRDAAIEMGGYLCPACREQNYLTPHFSAWRFIKLPPQQLILEELKETMARIPSLRDAQVKRKATA